MPRRGSAIIGRDDELRKIQSVLSAAQDGRGGAVFVVGEPGIGKSRLADAAADLGFAAGMSIMRGRGSNIGPMVPFRSLTEALMSLLRSRPMIDITALGPYRPILAQLVPEWGSPSPGRDSGSVAVLAEGVLRLTALAGRHGGCLLILDDLQDADAQTLAVIEYLTDNLAAQPTVLLGTVRAGSSPALDLAKAVTRRGSGILLSLPRLAEQGVHELVASCLGSPPDVRSQFAEYVWAGSAGIPLIVVELIEEALASGLLVHDSTGWTVTGELRHRITTPGAGAFSRAAIPQSIACALLLARTLSERERTVFEWLGQGYDNRSIAREMNISERTVKRHITVILTKLDLESRLQAGLAALITSADSTAGAVWPEGRMAIDSPARDNDRN